MHELTKLTEEFVEKIGQEVSNKKGVKIINAVMDWNAWESEVLLPYMKEWEMKLREYLQEKYKDDWGIEKRKEQAEWLKKQYWENNLSLNTTLIDQAFGLIKTCDKCGQRIE